MSLLDAAVLCVLVAAVTLGHRRGLRARARAWLGAGAGLALGLAVAWAATRGRTGWNAAIVAFIGLFVPITLGYLTGRAAHRQPIYTEPESQDRLLGALTTGTMTVLLVWVLVPMMAALPSTAGERAATSATLEVIDALGGPIRPVDDIAMRIAAPAEDTAPPEVVEPASGPPEPVAVPDEAILTDGVRSEMAASVVGVNGVACGSLIEGTGFVISPGVVATNAHVVAGVDEVRIDLPTESGLVGSVVLFDAATDLALIRVPDLAAEPLRLAATPGRDAVGEVIAAPDEDPAAVLPYRVAGEVTATGRDIYQEGQTRRQVLYLAAELDSGHSGAPLADADGVTGMVFAVAPDDGALAFALTANELAALDLPDDEAPAITTACR